MSATHIMPKQKLGGPTKRTTPIAKKSKRQRNCQSARQSRQRKNKYIESVQNNIKSLEAQLLVKERQLSNVQQTLSSFLIKNQMNNSFNHQEAGTYQRLDENCSADSNTLGEDEDQINLLLDVLINRIGVTGKERNRKVHYYASKLINFSFPAIYRYLLIASHDKADLYGDCNNNYEWTQTLRQKLSLTPTQTQKFKAINDYFYQHYSKVTEQIQEFKRIKQAIYNVSTQIEQEILQWRGLLTPKQSGRFIIEIEKRKYNENVELQENLLRRYSQVNQ